MLTEMRHVGIVVTDMDRMVAFYRDFLGFSVAVDTSEQGEFIDTVQGLSGVNVRMVKLGLPDGSLVELLSDAGHPLDEVPRRSLCDGGIVHVAFTVGDVEDVYKRFCENDLETLSSPVTSPDGKARLFFGRDPEGNLLELVQMLTG